ncbi:MAG: hypothetical protein U0V03_12690 [Bacteroidia bacterium]
MLFALIFFDSIKLIHKNIKIKKILACIHLSNPISSSKFIEGILCPGNEHNNKIINAQPIKYNFGRFEITLRKYTSVFFS